MIDLIGDQLALAKAILTTRESKGATGPICPQGMDIRPDYENPRFFDCSLHFHITNSEDAEVIARIFTERLKFQIVISPGELEHKTIGDLNALST